MSASSNQLPPEQEQAVRRVLASQPALSHPVLPTSLKWLQTAGMLVPLVYGVALLPLVVYRSSTVATRIFWTAVAFQLCATTLLFILTLRARARIRKMLAPHECFVCLRCHYPLSTLAEHGQCPECGTFYLKSEVVRAWRVAFHIRRAK
jgi:hypothetical protein